jgi:hypothetical protein
MPYTFPVALIIVLDGFEDIDSNVTVLVMLTISSYIPGSTTTTAPLGAEEIAWEIVAYGEVMEPVPVVSLPEVLTNIVGGACWAEVGRATTPTTRLNNTETRMTQVAFFVKGIFNQQESK